MTLRVVMTAEAAAQFDSLPITIRARVANVIARLAAWPEVSGAKPMRGDLKGNYRVRTGDWRVLFRIVDNVVVVRIAHRREVYEN